MKNENWNTGTRDRVTGAVEVEHGTRQKRNFVWELGNLQREASCWLERRVLKWEINLE